MVVPSENTNPRVDRCRVCDAPAPSEGPFAPFCSERCRLADLNNWFTGRYVVSREPTPDDVDLSIRREGEA